LEALECGILFEGGFIPALAFADDLVLLASDSRQASLLLSELHRHSVQWRYDVNIKKCAAYVFGSPSQERVPIDLSFAGMPLPRDPNYSYLGIAASALRGRPGFFIQQRVSAARSKLPLLTGSVGARFNGLRPSLSLSLWNALIRPGLEWGCVLLSPTKSMLQQLNSVLASALRSFVGVDTFTPTDALMAEFGAQSFSSRQRELVLRYFMKLCTADPNRILCKIFRVRCAQTKHGVAPFSLCTVFHSVLERLDLLDVWHSMPRDPKDELWRGWKQKIRRKAIDLDLAERKQAILARPSLSLFAELKPLDVSCVPSYLDRRGLGSWVKLKLRTSSLPLGDFLVRHCVVSLAASDVCCRLCSSSDVESPLHFVCVCPRLAPERDALVSSLVADSVFSSLDGAHDILQLLNSGSPYDRLLLMLASVESVTTSTASTTARSSGTRRTVSVVALPFVCPTALLARFEALSLPFLASIWRRRAAILKGVPSLNLKGDSVVLSQLRDDGRCRSFAVGSVSAASARSVDSVVRTDSVSCDHSSSDRSLGSPRCL
jgi:hypothetical protein